MLEPLKNAVLYAKEAGLLSVRKQLFKTQEVFHGDISVNLRRWTLCSYSLNNGISIILNGQLKLNTVFGDPICLRYEGKNGKTPIRC